jgi:hypothetical protein
MADKTPEEKAEYLFELKRREAERVHDRSAAFADSTNEATVTSGLQAARTAILVNGGAAVSMLGFIGALTGQGRLTVAQMSNVASGLLWFGGGVALGMLCVAFSYFTNYAYVSITNSKLYTWEHPYLMDGPTTKLWTRWGASFHVVAVVTGILAVAAFVAGIVDVYHSIVALSAQIPKSP